jgi:hypothetical protein
LAEFGEAVVQVVEYHLARFVLNVAVPATLTDDDGREPYRFAVLNRD